MVVALFQIFPIAWNYVGEQSQLTTWPCSAKHGYQHQSQFSHVSPLARSHGQPGFATTSALRRPGWDEVCFGTRPSPRLQVWSPAVELNHLQGFSWAVAKAVTAPGFPPSPLPAFGGDVYDQMPSTAAPLCRLSHRNSRGTPHVLFRPARGQCPLSACLPEMSLANVGSNKEDRYSPRSLSIPLTAWCWWIYRCTESLEGRTSESKGWMLKCQRSQAGKKLLLLIPNCITLSCYFALKHKIRVSIPTN